MNLRQQLEEIYQKHFGSYINEEHEEEDFKKPPLKVGYGQPPLKIGFGTGSKTPTVKGEKRKKGPPVPGATPEKGERKGFRPPTVLIFPSKFVDKVNFRLMTGAQSGTMLYGSVLALIALGCIERGRGSFYQDRRLPKLTVDLREGLPVDTRMAIKKAFVGQKIEKFSDKKLTDFIPINVKVVGYDAQGDIKLANPATEAYAEKKKAMDAEAEAAVKLAQGKKPTLEELNVLYEACGFEFIEEENTTGTGASFQSGNGDNYSIPLMTGKIKRSELKEMLKQAYLNELSTGLSNRATAGGYDKSSSNLEDDPITANVGRRQGTKFEKYINPQLLQYMDNQGFKNIQKTDNNIEFDAPFADNSGAVKITIDLSNYKTSNNGNIKLLSDEMLRKVKTAIPKIKADLKTALNELSPFHAPSSFRSKSSNGHSEEFDDKTLPNMGPVVKLLGRQGYSDIKSTESYIQFNVPTINDSTFRVKIISNEYYIDGSWDDLSEKESHKVDNVIYKVQDYIVKTLASGKGNKNTLNELSTGLGNAASAAAYQKTNKSSYKDPADSIIKGSQARDFGLYINPELKSYLEKLGFKGVTKRGNGVELILTNEGTGNYNPQGGMNNEIIVIVNSNEYKVTKGDLRHVGDLMIRKLKVAIPKIQADLRSQDKPENLLEVSYSQFDKQTKFRSKPQQMNEALKSIYKKINEINKLVEYTSRIKNELNESETSGLNETFHKNVGKISNKLNEVVEKTKLLTDKK